jgi:armadillo repeat-containing protein 8
MTRGFDPPLSLQVLRSATTLQKQLDALKQLKNDIIGHEKRKQLIISNGVSELLSRCLALRRSRAHHHLLSTAQSLDPVDQVKLQALFIVTSLSHGKPALLLCFYPRRPAVTNLSQPAIHILHRLSTVESSLLLSQF